VVLHFPLQSYARLVRNLSSMKANVRHGFDRLFVVLTCAWVIYCLLVYPIQQAKSAGRLSRLVRPPVMSVTFNTQLLFSVI
jgi:hypothetical protein